MILPEKMIAIRLAGTGGPDVLEPQSMSLPSPAAGQVLIKVVAAGVNRPDIAQREGRYPVPADASPIPGLEISGHVAAIGEGTVGFTIGDPVCALVHGGGYAEYTVADAGTTLPVPQNLSVENAAALPEVAFTVELNMVQRAGLVSGETVLIHGGSSGIGAHAIERAKAEGCKVIVTAGTHAKCDWCISLGADHAINYRHDDFVEETLSYTNGRGTDVVIDMVGGPYVNRNLKAMASDGRCAVISLQAGREATADFNEILRRRLTIIGSTLRPLPPLRKAALARDVFEHVWPLVAQGVLSPKIRRRFKFDQAADAHRAMEAPDHMGKIILVTGA